MTISENGRIFSILTHQPIRPKLQNIYEDEVSPRHCEVSVSPPSTDDDDEEDGKPRPLCCLEGCLIGSIATFLFLIVIPAGILLTMYGINSKSDAILGTGICLIIVPVLSVPVFIGIYANQRRLKRLRKRLGRNQVCAGQSRTSSSEYSSSTSGY